MKKVTFAACALTLAAGLAACGDRKPDNAAATQEEAGQTANPDEPYAVPGQTNTYSARLGGNSYEITVSREADKQLPSVTDDLGKKFYDNRVSVSVTRNGEAFFSRSYTKEAFADFLTPAESQGTVLLGMAYDSEKSDGHAIRLGAQIGQVGIEEGPAFSVEIPLDGSASGIVRDKNQDTTGDDGMTD